MQDKVDQHQFAAWYSTYGFLTVDRVLEHLQINLKHDDIVNALKPPNHIFHAILHVPMWNIFNGIIFQQAYDYQVYAQKLMIDYRLSPEFSKDSQSPGGNIRSDLNEQYNELLSAVKSFNHHQNEHYQLISESQAYLIERISAFSSPLQELDILNDDIHFKEQLTQYTRRAEELNVTFRSFRSRFYDMILRLTERLVHLPEYQFDVENAAKQRESLFFDKEIGGE